MTRKHNRMVKRARRFCWLCHNEMPNYGKYTTFCKSCMEKGYDKIPRDEATELLDKERGYNRCAKCTIRCGKHKCEDCFHNGTSECHFCENKDLYVPKN